MTMQMTRRHRITRRKREALLWIINYQLKHGYAPTVTELSAYLYPWNKWRGRSNANVVLHQLCAAGYLTRLESTFRGVVLNPPEEVRAAHGIGDGPIPREQEASVLAAYRAWLTAP